MTRRPVEQRVADVRRLLEAGRSVFDRMADLAPGIAASTGLTPEGVKLGFGSLERGASDGELRALVAAAGDAESVHVILASNVFVAPLRALALARAASGRVTVRPSSREQSLTRAIVEAAGDDALSVVGERDVAAFDCAEIHVYGRGSTIEAVRRRARRGAIVRAHGPGFSVAVATASADLKDAAGAMARDVAAFDQRGCLSPLVAFVEGGVDRGVRFAGALHRRLEQWERRVPRGRLADSERAGAALWCSAIAFAGRLWPGAAHAVGLAPAGSPLALPPSGRHVLVAVVRSLEDLAAQMAPVSGQLICVGTDAPDALRRIVPPGARVCSLGRMQRPPLDGPVDRRASEAPLSRSEPSLRESLEPTTCSE